MNHPHQTFDVIDLPKRRAAPVAIIGGGPAGLTAAYELLKLDPSLKPVVLEASDYVGGIARTESYKGFRFDIGGHRFFTKVKEVEDLWHEVLGNDFITVRRQSRIYYRGRYFDYPLKLVNALSNMGVVESVLIGLSYLRWRAFPGKVEENLEQWVTNRFGDRLFRHFFKTYTEKVWGIPSTEVRADWAAQRIKNLSLTKAVWNALTGSNDTASLIEEFKYPRLGPGMMWETFERKIAERGGSVRKRSSVRRIVRDHNRVKHIEVAELDAQGLPCGTTVVEADQFISSMAMREMILCMDPAPPAAVRAAAAKLKYRDFLIVSLILDRADPFPDNWIYIHSPDVAVGRIQNFRAWSEEMVPHADKSCIGMEYFCNQSDALWQTEDAVLIEQAAGELERLGLAPKSSVVDGTVTRQPKAYPVYDANYRDAVETIRDWLATLTNFQTVGRNGMHRYNNQDHSMLTAMLAARNVVGERHDVWDVNLERSYHEEFVVAEREPVASVK